MLNNHPITIARGRLVGYWGSGIREGRQGESEEGGLLGGGFKGEDQSVSLSHAVAAERQIYTQIEHQHKLIHKIFLWERKYKFGLFHCKS